MGVRYWIGNLSAAAVLVTSPLPEIRAAGKPLQTGKPWVDMDYGPFLTASIEAPHPATNIAYKGIAIKLGQAFGGTRNEAVLFDTDLLRYSAGWTGDFVALKGVVFDGEHWAYPSISGQQVFGNPPLPGWARAGRLEDPRAYPYGPLPREWAHWKGLYLHGNKVLFSYTVGKMPVLEMPGLERDGDVTAFARTLNLGSSATEQVVQIAFDAKKERSLVRLEDMEPIGEETPANRTLVVMAPARAQPAEERALHLSVEQGLLGRWEFEEAGGSGATNQSGPAGTIQLHGVGRIPDGRTGAALELRGNEYGEIDGPEKIDFQQSDLTITAWIKTRRGGTILAKTALTNRWVPNGKSLFVRNGRLTFDVGWVGYVQSSRSVQDGHWHHVALIWSHADGRATLFVDGLRDGSAILRPKAPLPTQTVRIGFTSPDFPGSPWFEGSLDDLRIYRRPLSGAELAFLANATARATLLAVGVRGAPEEARWLATPDGHVRLHLPTLQRPAHLKILIWEGARELLPEFARLVKSAPAPEDLAQFTHGGPARWPEKVDTRGALGTGDGPYVIDTITAPEENPWNSWMRFGGVDLFTDNRRAALSTWNGDVWLVSGVDGSLENLRWQRIAAGLFQPLGLKIVEDRLYVLGRDQITLLHDLNADGEADFYQNFNNDCMVSEHFHEFATDLKTDQQGNFYYIKCARHARDAIHPHHGTLLKVSPDGSRSEVIARGLRAVNGLGVGPNGELTCVDNQGHWMPGNRINWMRPGGFYGNMWAFNPDKRIDYDPPLCWMHNFVDRSGGTHLWIPNHRWGPLQGELITISYGMGHMFLVLKEPAGNLMQGGVTRFPLDFPTGVMRGVFHPTNHQLYTCGLYGWAGNKTKAGGFYRVRYTGRPLHMPNELRIAQDGILLGFTDPLDVASATDPGNYDIKAWNYRWSEQYGSPDFKRNGREGRDTLPIASATLSADHQRVFLKVPEIQPVMQMHIVVNLKAADGSRIRNFVHNTIHQLGTQPGLSLLGEGSIVQGAATRISLNQETQGLIQTFTLKAEPERRDTRPARLAALFVPRDAPPTPFLQPAPFRTEWNGYLKLDLNEEILFETQGSGTARLRINGQIVLDASLGNLHGARSQAVALRSGLNHLALSYESPQESAAEFRLLWSAKGAPLEPVPPTAFVHDSADPELRAGQLARQGRALFVEHRCVKCHQPDQSWGPHAMPELAADAPALDGIGSRLNQAWMAQWILDPQSLREDALMPRCLTGDAASEMAGDIALFLASLHETTRPVTAGATTTDSAPEPPPANGETLFTELGCVACHRLPGDRPWANDPRLNLGHVKAKWRAAALKEFLRAPTRQYRWIRMPDFQLDAKEASALADYLLARGDPVPPAPAASNTGNPKRGGELLATQGCLACHNLAGEKDASAAPKLAELAQGAWERGCMGETPMRRGRAPDFAFAPEKQRALQHFARSDGIGTLHRYVPAEFAARQYTSLRCNACHSRDHEPDLWTRVQAEAQTAPSSTVDDEEQAALAGRSVHIGRPPLTLAGEKLWAGWMERFLAGQLPYKPRSELHSRMPAVPAFAQGLAAGMAHQHGYPAENPPPTEPDLQLAEVGRRLTGLSDGFSCVSCHDVGNQKALAGKDTATVNFAFVADRLRPSYYWRYIQDPPHLLPSTMMPKFISDDGTTPIKSVYDGDPERQFTAIWHYLLSLRNRDAAAQTDGTARPNSMPP